MTRRSVTKRNTGKNSRTQAWARSHPEIRNRIQLSNGTFALIDPENYDRVIAYPWRPLTRGHPSSDSVGLLRRFVLGAGDGEMVTNINGDLLDNRRQNLRRCTSFAEISAGRRPSRSAGKWTRTSTYKGVTKLHTRSRAKRFRAQITVDGKMRFLGYFPSGEEAARAYDVAAVAAWGDHARLNFPDTPPPDPAVDERR